MKYPFKVYQTQIEKHVFWIAESPCLKGCVGQGETINEAISELEENEAVWLETAKECGIEIPSVPIETINDYSGKFTVRVSPTVHMIAATYAQKENISLNQYVNDAIITQNTRYETIGQITTGLKEAIETLKMLLPINSPTFSNGEAKVSVNNTYNNIFPNFNKFGTATNSANVPYMVTARA